MAQPSPCDTESAYYCIAIERDAADPDVRVLVLDRLTHAAVDLRDPTNLEFGYVRRFADATAPFRAGLGAAPDVLHVGGGGFTFPRYIEAMHPEARQTVLELDPADLRDRPVGARVRAERPRSTCAWATRASRSARSRRMRSTS